MKNILILTLIVASFIPRFAQATEPSVVINEIAWMGTTTSANDEWIELRNTTDTAIDITGWQLKTTDGGLTATLTGTIAPNGYYLLERTDDDTVPGVIADTIYTGSLSNTGEILELTNSNGAVIDRLDASVGWPAGDNATKQTLERTAANTWQTSTATSGTPKVANSITENNQQNEEPAPETQNDTATSTNQTTQNNGSVSEKTTPAKKNEVVFNELFPDPVGPDNDEFIELKNISVNPVTLTNSTLETIGGQRYTLPSLTMYPGSIVVFTRLQTKLALRNSREKITLKTEGGTTISSAEYRATVESQSYQRTTKGAYVWATPTPAQENEVTETVTPTAIISGPTSAAVGDIVTFDGSDSFDPNNRPFILQWSFGNGATAYGALVRHVFPAPGTYTVSLTALVNQNASSTEEIKIKITGEQIIETPTTTSSTTDTTIPATETLPAIIPNIFITEFLPNPDGSDKQEFIELFNGDVVPVDLNNWRLDDNQDGSRPYRFLAPTILEPGEYKAFYQTETKIALNNDSDEVRLFAPDGTIVDVASYEQPEEKRSFVRTEDGSWEKTNTITPDELNMLDGALDTPTTTSATATPTILGADNAEEVPAPTANNNIKYLLSGMVAVTVLGTTAMLGRKKWH